MIEVSNISVGYGHDSVLKGITFSLDEGEIIALLGPNGAGKTTLIRSLNRTVALKAGEIRFKGRSLKDLSRREIARSIAVVAQENETKFPITVLEFVLAGRFVHGGTFGWETDADHEVARRALVDCDLAQFGDRFMNELSGGERQRVILARALAAGSGVLLLDEPTANLDLAHQAMMFRLVRERCRSCNASAVVITHDLNLAAEFADRIMLLSAGGLFALGRPNEVLTAENINAVFGVKVLLDKNPASGKARVTTVFSATDK